MNGSPLRVRLRSFARSSTPFVAHRSGISHAIAQRYRGRGVIFMLHSVVPDDAFYPEAMLRCPAGRLDWMLRWLKARGIAFVTLDEAIARLDQPQSAPFAAFTCDDGYADNFTHALPVMERHNAPFTVFVTTGMMTGEIDAWWFGLSRLIATRDSIELAGKRFDCPDRGAKQRTFMVVESMIHGNYALLPEVKRLIAANGIDCRALALQEGLDRDQLRKLASHPLATIGGHTTTHINLAQAAASEVDTEMRANRAFLEGILQAPIRHFAYPFGNVDACGPREANIAAAAGFRSAVTTRRGTLFPEHLRHLHELPREPLTYADTPSSMRCKVDGFYRALHSRLGDPVALM
ncbi:MAG: polysaccharide deacetylase family protein [Alphaproteobacteria bacterium]